jgi:hypothetical protein
MTDLRLRWLGTVGSRSDAGPLLRAAGDAVLVERGRPRLLLLMCPCGCGEILPVNLDERSGPAWRLYRGERGLSLYPSVWRESGCESHFVIWRDDIFLFGRYRGEDGDLDQETQEAQLREAVLERLTPTDLTPYLEIADALDAVPWDVHSTCRMLVRDGLAREGTGSRRGHFGLR